MEECDQKTWSFSAKSGMFWSGSDTYFLKVSEHVCLKVITKVCLRGKKNWKFRLLGCFSKAKTEDCDQKIQTFSDLSLAWSR